MPSPAPRDPDDYRDMPVYITEARPTGPYQVVRDFEAELCRYTGAKFAVTTSSCTMALLLAVRWAILSEHSGQTWNATDGWVEKGPIELSRTLNSLPWEYRPVVEIPRRTYVGVACSIVHAGGRPTFRDEEWSGAYRLDPYPIWDSARWFTEGLYHRIRNTHGGPGSAFVAVSFHASKTLAIEQGGCVLHDDPEADAWLRRMRFDGRTQGVAPKDDDFREAGFHCYMGPSVAALGLLKLHSLPRHNEPLENSEYSDLSLASAFR